ncbi:uncharacterized protein DSM5745_05032 [Aspergillus mulundensis]|uniref:SIS domain-containing protein n=1 Tax=Aspergillus mulundensis TaxID=1810919 RepID=A0A3D8S596_9EURO|nr:hypothetical protein DSM5745_05032 [Aspergillus mulundensis]RDW81475.1 hypothetical protein DSM5745_05032 [Aspergillus mulundensis]
MPASGASIRSAFAGLPMTPPEPADGVLAPANPIPKDAASVASAIHVISTERAALAHLERLYQTDQLAQEHLSRAVDQITRTVRDGGKLVVCGVGKSGKIGKKLEATMNSLGIYSTFLHPTEALHGDLGMIRPNDTLLLISFSGRTPELLLLLPHIHPTITIIALTSHLHPSTCPLLSFQPLDKGILLPAPIHEDEETSIGVCAPTSSTTVALALGDALAIATARKLHTAPGRGPAEVFKSYHPGGAIGGASTASTPLSMSSSGVSFTSNPSDFLPGPVRQPQPQHQHNRISSLPDTEVPDADQSQSESDAEPEESIPPPDSIANMITVPLSQIPTLSPSPSTGKPRLLDVLLTAIQHPDARSWVFVSPDLLMAPRQLRYLSSNGYVDMDISSLSRPFIAHREDWTYITDEHTIDEAKEYFPSDDPSRGNVVAVVRGQDFDNVLGVFEIEDLWDS